MHEGASPTGLRVVFKCVEKESDEVKILKYFKKHNGSEHHLIKLHEVILYSFDNIVVLPWLTPLPYAVHDIEKSELAMIPEQFLEGVAFMHQHKVAHLDLKADNIVVGQSGPSGRLAAYIVDFDCSVMVEGVETMIQGMYGTRGWTAPEVTATGRYHPILADRWACGKMLLYFEEFVGLSGEMKLFSCQLMSSDPDSRPGLLRNCVLRQKHCVPTHNYRLWPRIHHE
jgi:serine/threonine protein kinase